jgi:YidC/Oxa1 family membrane protein insertase
VHNVLTKSNMFLIKYVAVVLGLLMNGIFFILTNINIPNVGLAIILFTIVIYAALTPLQIKQQRFSRMNAIMMPEIRKIQDKYKGKRDQISQQKMMDETNAVYAKYGVSPSGSCVQLLIQMPILFALYQVIYKIPGYITLIGTKITELANADGFQTFFSQFVTDQNNATLTQTLTSAPETANYVDAIYKLNTTQWNDLLTAASGKSFEAEASSVHEYVNQVTNFLTLNISDSPLNILTSAWKSGAVLMIIVAIMIPVLAWLTQRLNYKLMPQQTNDGSSMASTMNSMNMIMPIMSAFFCFTLPTGIGIYWIIGALVRTVQMWIINKKMDKEDMNEVIKKNLAKAEEKRKKYAEKYGSTQEQINRARAINTRSIDGAKTAKQISIEERMKALEEREAVKPAEGSIAARANMVADYDEKHNTVRKHADAKKK